MDEILEVERVAYYKVGMDLVIEVKEFPRNLQLC